MNNYADEIKARVPLLELLNFYGFHPSYNRMPCPFHNGKDRNMLVSHNFYKCFVCGESGDAISFVQRHFGLDFNSACAKINDDFRLGLPIGKTLTQAEQVKANQEEAARRRRAEEKQRRLDGLQTAYNKALEEYTSCDTIIRRCAPISPQTGFTAAFCWAVQNIERAWYELKEAEYNLYTFSLAENR